MKRLLRCMRKTTPLFLSLVFLSFMACGAAGTKVTNPPTTTYPTNLSISSPTESGTTTSSSLNLSLYDSDIRYAVTAAEFNADIDAILNGTVITDCPFDPPEFFTKTNNAACYGPAVKYEFHPDGPPFDGEFPSGDLGMWQVTNGGTEACSGAQLNALIENQKSNDVLMVIASANCAQNVITGTPLSDMQVGDADIDLKDNLNTMLAQNGLTMTEFLNATVSVSADATTGNRIFTYSMQFTQGSNLVQITFQHEPEDETGDVYRGKFTYLTQFDSSITSKCATANTVIAASTIYQRTSSVALKFQAESATFCGDIASLPDPFTADGVLNRLNKNTSSLGGWIDNYSTFTASADPDTLVGQYYYAWQAGDGDGWTRVFNVNIELAADTNRRGGNAYFGFGKDIADSFEGGIATYFCNWAGPGGMPGPGRTDGKSIFQHQVIEENADGVFEASSSFITYAPTLTCNYLTGDTNFGFFTYDAIGGQASPNTDPSKEITNNLIVGTDADGDGFFDEIDMNLPIVIETL